MALPLVAGASGTPAAAAVVSGYVRSFSSGGSGSEVVTTATHVYVTNPSANRVEVLSLGTGTLEDPIAVGSSPSGVDLSADRTRLYVVNGGGNDISVIDLSLRREERRILLPAGTGGVVPTSIAVADNGTAMITRETVGASSVRPPVLQVTLGSGTVRERPEARLSSFGRDRARVRASGDRSRVGFVDDGDEMGVASVYTAATDSFGPRRFLTNTAFLALDATGSTMLAGADTMVIDRDLVVRATIPGAGSRGLALNRPGTIGYRTRGGGNVEVLNPSRGLVTGSIAVPGSSATGTLALTPDNATLVVLTGTGIAVVPADAAVPTPACTTPAPSSLLRVCGALADIVVDGRGLAYVSNRERNQVEVVTLATRSLGVPIHVGSQPTSLDLSADGSTLLVANSGAEDVSVVDLNSRREVRRFTLPSSLSHIDRPFSIATAGNGTGLLTTARPGIVVGDRFFQFDLVTGVMVERTDLQPLHLEASGDHSRIVATPSGGSGTVHRYSAATGTFDKAKEVSGGISMVAVDRTASKVLVGPGAPGWDPGTYVLDGDLTRRATMSSGLGIAVDPSGTTGYLLQATAVEVLDLARGLAVRSLALPEVVPTPTRLAVSHDNTTVVVLTPSGIAILAVAAATPVPSCSPVTTPPVGVIGTCGALAEVVVDGRGRAYASNPALNQIEVVTLATGALEEPIPVGSRPRGLDLSPDARTLYVANSGAEEISVVDLSVRREVRRITVSSIGYNDRPVSIAVGDRGLALVSTTMAGFGYGAHILQLDLARETITLRPEPLGWTTKDTHLKASGDRSKIAVVREGSEGEVHMYTTSTDTFAARRAIGNYLSVVAVDGAGSKVLVGPGGYVLGDDLRTLVTIPGEGKGVAVSADGTTGYRVQDSTVEVLDLDQAAVVRSIPLPERVGDARGVALSTDGTTLVVVTRNGLAIVPAGNTTLQTPYSVWSQPAPSPLDGVGSWIGIVNTPTAAAGQRPPMYLYGHYFRFANSTALGVIGLVTEPAGKYALVTVADPNGPPRSAVVPFNWSAGHFYFPLVRQLAPGLWGAWVFDATANAWTTIGTLALPAQWGRLSPTSVTAASWYGAMAPRCSGYPAADVVFAPPTGFVGSTATTAGVMTTGHNPGGCPAEASVESSVWARYRLGTGATPP